MAEGLFMMCLPQWHHGVIEAGVNDRYEARILIGEDAGYGCHAVYKFIIVVWRKLLIKVDAHYEHPPQTLTEMSGQEDY